MEITWHGYSCFRMNERGTLTVVTDPYEKSVGDELGKLKADVITISRDDPAHNNANAIVGAQRGDVKQIVGPGEYEIGGVFVTGVAIKPEKKSDKAAHKSTAYAFNFEGLSVVHLGGLSYVPAQTEIDALETVDILLVPVGGGDGLSAAQASEIISLIEPSIVIPMHFRAEGLHPKAQLDGVAKFLKEMGLSDVKTQDSLKITRSQLPETTQVVVLEVKQ